MPKPLAISIAVCLSLTGCQLVEKSPVWETVMSVRPGDSFREADPSSSYADKLHHVLRDQGVEHMVVTYQYHYYTHKYEEALGTRTAVVYRDNSNANYPWWLKDDRLATPFWLPNGSLDKQLSFYARRPVQVIEKQVYPAHGGSGKSTVAHFHGSQMQSREQFAHRSQPVTKIAQVRPAPTPPAKPAFAFLHPSSVGGTSAAVTRIQRLPATGAARNKSAKAPAPAPAYHWSFQPAAIAKGPDKSSPEARLEKLFRTRNGTHFDHASSVDRRKMELLRHGLIGMY